MNDDSDTDLLRKVTVLETKLDIMMKQLEEWHNDKTGLSKRVDELESIKAYVSGAIAAVTVLTGTLVWAGTQYAKSVAQDAVDNIEYIEETCNEVRRKGTRVSDLPKLCGGQLNE